mgnify:CR=1 FL=1
MQIILPIKILIYNIDVVFSPMNIMPLVLKIIGIKCVSVIHNNLPWLYPQDVPGSKIKSLLQRFLINLTVRYSDKLIVDSQIAKNELVKLFPFIFDKKVYIRLGILFYTRWLIIICFFHLYFYGKKVYVPSVCGFFHWR